MKIIKNMDYTSGDFRYRNFTTLSVDELLMILRERNHPDVKKWMYTDEDIEESSHLAFVENLKTRDDAFYWLMLYREEPIGVLSLVHCDYDKNEADPGYYLFANYQNAGIGLEMHVGYKNFMFHQLGVDTLASNILYGNSSAMQLTLFFGGQIGKEKIIDGKRFVSVRTTKEDYDAVDKNRLTLNFVKYIKKNPIKWE